VKQKDQLEEYRNIEETYKRKMEEKGRNGRETMFGNQKKGRKKEIEYFDRS